jgi:hypothetical protein
VIGRALAALAWALVLCTPALAVDWNVDQFEVPSGAETLRLKPNAASGDIPLGANLCALTVSGLVCEGATADALEGRLAMPEASGADNLWSLPPGGGVLVTGPLTYSGVGPCGANSWVSALTDHAAPTCTQPGFASLSGTAGAIGYTELNNSYVASADPPMPANKCAFTNYSTGGIVCEGETADAFEMTLFVGGGMSSDQYIYFPNASGSVCLSGNSCQDINLFDNTTIGNASGNDKLEFNEEPGNAACGAGNYAIWANSTDLKLKKCQDGTITDLDTVGAPASGVGACAANSWASTLNAGAAPTCTQPSFASISGSATDAQIPDTITVNQAGSAALCGEFMVDPAGCPAGQYASDILADGGLICSQVNFSQLAGTATDAQIPDSITVAHAGMADTLTTDPADCPPGEYASVINEAGDLACAQVDFSELAGAATNAQLPATLTGKTIDDANNTLVIDGTSITTGTIPVSKLNATGQGSSKFVRSDGTWAFPLRTACVAIDNVTSATLKPFWIAPDSSVTITALRCNYFDSCATPPTVQPQDQAATVIGPSSIACVAGTIGTWTTISTANILAARSVLYMKVTNTPTATCDMLVCVQYLG